jgi:hypothetical protein
MKQVLLGMVVAVSLAGLSATDAFAQSRNQGTSWWEWAAPEVVGGQKVATRKGTVSIPEPRGNRRGNGRAQGNGPAFCRSGEGHPVHGRQWCIDKGWGLGNRAFDPRWERRRWEDIIFGSPRDRRRSGTLDERALADVLGRVALERIQTHQHQLGAHGPIAGRWIDTGARGGRVLQLRSGGIPVAELTDLDGDGRVDLVLVYRGN